MGKKALQGMKNVNAMLKQQRHCGYDERLDKLERKSLCFWCLSSAILRAISSACCCSRDNKRKEYP